MTFENPWFVILIGLAALLLAGWVWRGFFSTESRLERRRRRNNARIASNARRPMVKFSVRTKKED